MNRTPAKAQRLARCVKCHHQSEPEKMAMRAGRRTRVCQVCEDEAEHRRSHLRHSTPDEKRRVQVRARVARYRARYPEKHNARELVRVALKSGRLKRPARCEALRCGKPPEVAHHASYARHRRLIVTHLCDGHHREVHRHSKVRLKRTARFKFARAPRRSAG